MLDEIDIRLRSLELKCRRPVEHLLAGEFRSVFRGRGVEFEDVRLYQPGDDVRAMDWKVTARTGKPHIKRFVEEREHSIYLLVDLSASMRHGKDGAKRQTLAEVGSLLTLAAVKNQDRVALILFTDQVEWVVPPGKGRRQALRIMDALLHFEPRGRRTDLSSMLGTFGRMARKHSVAFILSDFFVETNVSELRALSLKHDLNAIRITDKAPERGLQRGLLRIEDAEDGAQQVVDLDAFPAAEAEAQASQLRDQLIDRGVGYLNVETGSDCVAALTGFFRVRQQRGAAETGGV